MELDHTKIDPVFTAMQQQVCTEAISYRAEAVQRLAELAATEQLVFASTLTVFPLGLILLAGLLFIVRTYQRRIDEGTSAELARLGTHCLDRQPDRSGQLPRLPGESQRTLASVSDHGKSLAGEYCDKNSSS